MAFGVANIFKPCSSKDGSPKAWLARLSTFQVRPAAQNQVSKSGTFRLLLRYTAFVFA